MEILIATNKDFETVKYIIHTTIKEIECVKKSLYL